MNRVFYAALTLAMLVGLGCSNNEPKDVLDNTTADDVAEYKRILADEQRQNEELYNEKAVPK